MLVGPEDSVSPPSFCPFPSACRDASAPRWFYFWFVMPIAIFQSEIRGFYTLSSWSGGYPVCACIARLFIWSGDKNNDGNVKFGVYPQSMRQMFGIPWIPNIQMGLKHHSCWYGSVREEESSFFDHVNDAQKHLFEKAELLYYSLSDNLNFLHL